MKYHKDIVDQYEAYLNTENIQGMFDISDELVTHIFFEYIYHNTKIKYAPVNERKRCKMIAQQINFTRLSLLRVKYARNGFKSKGIKEGFVYGITNKVFPGYIKIGSATSVYERLDQYQTYCPDRDFKLECYYFSNDRYTDEFAWHTNLQSKNEWCICDIPTVISQFEDNKRRDTDRLLQKIKWYTDLYKLKV